MDLLRVRVHLNLAHPEAAENVVKVASPKTGAWITVAYAAQLVMDDCVPVVQEMAQRRIEQGDARKTPHAFLEGNLVHFQGRWRDKVPASLLALARPAFVGVSGFEAMCVRAQRDGDRINYNPRFARCFYQHRDDRALVTQRFERCERMVVMGWAYWAQGAVLTPLREHDRCAPDALQRTNMSEALAVRRGLATTATMVGEVEKTARPSLAGR